MKILVVDDEADLETLIRQKFRKEVRQGTLDFLFARDGVEALSIMSTIQDVDIVLSDINMPRMDGLTLLEKLQNQEHHPSTVIVSAYGDMANIRVAMNRGAFDFLTKPIDFVDLETTIAKTLRHVEAQRIAMCRIVAAEKAQASLSRYFSPNLVQRLASNQGEELLAGQWREVTALFSDIEGFTTLVETIEPDILGELINEYVTGVTAIVFEEEGTVAKIVGDALHVLFGAPGDQPNHASMALACALHMDEFCQAFRLKWRDRGIALGVTRIGLNSGRALVGNFGGESYFDYTAYGDTINTAARLEAVNKLLGTRICVSRRVAEQVDGFVGRPVGDLVLKGKTEALRAFEPVPSESIDERLLEDYCEAFKRLEAEDAGALPAFAALVSRNPDDLLSSFHLKRLLNGVRSTVVRLDA